MGIFNFIRHLIHPTSANLEDLTTGDEISSLANDVLSEVELEKADQLHNDILSKGWKKIEATKYLRGLVGIRPKRPLYYVTDQFLPHLPNGTRDVIRYLGDYIDLLVKAMAQEIRGKRQLNNQSLGPNIEKLKGHLSDNTYDFLVRYNRFIYAPAKHDFNVKKRSHRFTLREVVLTVIITIKLAETIKSLSPLAREYAEDKLIY